jgi:hypothetical protein
MQPVQTPDIRSVCASNSSSNEIANPLVNSPARLRRALHEQLGLATDKNQGAGDNGKQLQRNAQFAEANVEHR